MDIIKWQRRENRSHSDGEELVLGAMVGESSLPKEADLSQWATSPADLCRRRTGKFRKQLLAFKKCWVIVVLLKHAFHILALRP